MIHYLKQFLLHPAVTGAIAQSSQRLANLITDAAQLHDKRSIVELGTGNGVFTEQILKKMGPSALFFGFEINPAFLRLTKLRCPQAIVYQDSAANLKKYLTQHSLQSVECIISGLPWASFSGKQQEQLIQAIHTALKDGGVFLTFAYVHGVFLPPGKRFQSLLKRVFAKVAATKTVWLNIPPAFVYIAEK